MRPGLGGTDPVDPGRRPRLLGLVHCLLEFTRELLGLPVLSFSLLVFLLASGQS